MGLAWTPGNALGCNVNSHRSGWGGQICQDAASWNCGATLDFRQGYCERGDGRCYHLNLFKEDGPSLVVDDHGVGWLLESNVHALDDQLLLLWGHQFSEPRGVRETGGQKAAVFGAYRIRRVEPITSHYRTIWRIVPYRDCWARFHNLQVERPRYQSLGGPYIKQVDRSAVQRLFRRVEEAADGAEDAWMQPEDRARFEYFHANLKNWLDDAAAKAPTVGGIEPEVLHPLPRASSGMLHKPFKDLRDHVEELASATASGHVGSASESPREVAARAVAAAATAAAATATAAAATVAPAPVHAGVASVREPKNQRLRVEIFEPLVEPACRSAIVELYGRSTLTAIQAASLTKPLLILRGNPGVGKSTLAHMLVDDPEGRRSLTVPVSSTWRGREDLFGYVNPINSEFEPTSVTTFLNEAANAWNQGDRRTRLVVFEEFNLSQPEFWLSEVLVRTQFPADARKERTIQLGGHRVRNWSGTNTGVFLAPSVRFVATVNSDHTTRPLSPRVLDRAAVVEITIEPRDAIAAVGLELCDDQVDAIADLDFLARGKGATFSLRTSRSLRACVENMDLLGLTEPWKAIDLVLAQEVLSKVRLLAGDPEDKALCDSLGKWSEPLGKHLPECSRLISLWQEMLSEGRDVLQV